MKVSKVSRAEAESGRDGGRVDFTNRGTCPQIRPSCSTCASTVPVLAKSVRQAFSPISLHAISLADGHGRRKIGEVRFAGECQQSFVLVAAAAGQSVPFRPCRCLMAPRTEGAPTLCRLAVANARGDETVTPWPLRMGGGISIGDASGSTWLTVAAGGHEHVACGRGRETRR